MNCKLFVIVAIAAIVVESTLANPSVTFKALDKAETLIAKDTTGARQGRQWRMGSGGVANSQSTAINNGDFGVANSNSNAQNNGGTGARQGRQWGMGGGGVANSQSTAINNGAFGVANSNSNAQNNGGGYGGYGGGYYGK